MSRRSFVIIGLVLSAATPAGAQRMPGDPYRRVEPAAAPGDKPDVWTLGFEYIPPRITSVDVPGAGKRTVWYMPYRIYNTTNTVQTPSSLRLELVTKDVLTPVAAQLDEPQPAVFAAVAKREDPDNIRKFKSVVELARTKVPVTRADSYPRYVYGLAIWSEAPKLSGKTNRFSVYVSGLSDGLVTEPAGEGRLVKVKTLQLDFFKPTDTNNPGIDDIQPDDNRGLGGERWIYRASVKRPAEAK